MPAVAVLSVSMSLMSFSMAAILSAGAEMISRLPASSGTIRTGVLPTDVDADGGA